MLKKLFGKKENKVIVNQELIDVATAYLHISEMGSSVKVEDLSPEQRRKLFAFELGIMEYIISVMLDLKNMGSKETQIATTSAYLQSFASTRYNEPSIVFPIYRKMIHENIYLRERDLGFKAIGLHTKEDGSKKEGHWPGKYYNAAIFGDIE